MNFGEILTEKLFQIKKGRKQKTIQQNKGTKNEIVLVIQMAKSNLINDESDSNKKTKNLLLYFIDHNVKTLVKIVSLIVKLKQLAQ